MADFDIEQMKTLLESLADKLAETKGDEKVEKLLTGINTSITTVSKMLASNFSPEQKKKDLDNFIRGTDQDQSSQLAELLKITKHNAANAPGTPVDLKTLGLDEHGKKLKDVGKDIRDSHQSTNRATKQSGSIFDVLKGALASKGRTGAIIGAGLELAISGLKELAKIVPENISNFRKLLNSGEGTIHSFDEMNETALRNNMTVDELVKTMTGASDAARLLGAKGFATLNNQIKQSTLSLGQLGLSADGFASAETDYLDQLKQRGTLVNINVDDIAKNIGFLVKSQDSVAQMLGEQADQFKKESKEQYNPNTTASAQARGLNDFQVTGLQDLLAAAQKNSGELKNLVADFYNLGTISPENKTGQTVAAAAPEIVAVVERTVARINSDSSVLSPENSAAFIADFQRQITEAAKNIPPALAASFAQQGQAGGTYSAPLTALNQLIQNARGIEGIKPGGPVNAPGSNTKENAVDIAADRANRGLLDLEQELKNAASTIKLIDYEGLIKPAFAALNTSAQPVIEMDGKIVEAGGQLAQILHAVAGAEDDILTSSKSLSEAFKKMGLNISPEGVAQGLNTTAGLAVPVASGLASAWAGAKALKYAKGLNMFSKAAPVAESVAGSLGTEAGLAGAGEVGLGLGASALAIPAIMGGAGALAGSMNLPTTDEFGNITGNYGGAEGEKAWQEKNDALKKKWAGKPILNPAVAIWNAITGKGSGDPSSADATKSMPDSIQIPPVESAIPQKTSANKDPIALNPTDPVGDRAKVPVDQQMSVLVQNQASANSYLKQVVDNLQALLDISQNETIANDKNWRDLITTNQDQLRALSSIGHLT